MRDVILPLREAYYSKLTGIGLDVYEEGAVTGEPPYVVIIGMSGDEASNKTDFGRDVQVTLDIVTQTVKGAAGGSKEADLIAAQIFQEINSKESFEIDGNLQSVNLKLIQDEKLTANTDTHKIFRRIIKFQHTIKQLQ